MHKKEILFLDDDREKGTKRDRKKWFRGILQRLQFIFCFLVEGALIVGGLYGEKGNAVILGLFVTLQIALWVWLHGKPGTRMLGKKRGTEYGRRKSVSIGISLCVAVFVALAAVLFRPAAYYNAVYRAEGHVTALLQNEREGKGLSTSGRINRGNLYPTEDVQLELAMSEAPTEPLYLRGFSGGDYVGNGWETADEEELFGESADIMNWEEWTGWIRWMYYSMYFILNSDNHQASERVLHIAHPNDDYSRVYVPYWVPVCSALCCSFLLLWTIGGCGIETGFGGRIAKRYTQE